MLKHWHPLLKIQPCWNRSASLGLISWVLGATPMGRLARAPHRLATSTRGTPRRFTTAGVFPNKWVRSFLDERALAQRQGLGGIVRRDRRDQPVVVPRIFRLFRLLHLEQIGRNEMAAVGAGRP